MSNFKQAIKWLREGKKVRRPKWNEDSYWEMGSEERICFHGRNAHVHLNQLEEKDWELYVKPILPGISSDWEYCEEKDTKKLKIDEFAVLTTNNKTFYLRKKSK